MNERGSIEILLLLCCLVGPVIFLCFATAVMKLGDPPPPYDPALVRRAAELEDLVDRKEHDIARREPAAESAARAKQDIEDLDRQQKELEARMATLQEEVARLKERTEDARRRQADAAREADRLKQQLDDLEDQIRQRVLEREHAKAPSAETDVKRQIEDLRAKLKDAQSTQARLRAELNELGDGVIDVTRTGGLASFSRPLWIECTPEAVELHPGGRYSLDTLASNSPFVAGLEDKHDVIKIFVRPGAFEVFGQTVLPCVEAAGLPVAYEPIEASVVLRFPDKTAP